MFILLQGFSIIMKTAQEIRAGNVIMVGNQPVVVQKSEYRKSGNTDVIKMNFRNLLNGVVTESVSRSDDKFEAVILDRKEAQYSYFADPMYVFMDNDYQQYEVEKADLGDTIYYLEDGMPCEVAFYDGKVISVDLPTTVVREIGYTEPAIKGDTVSGEVMKSAKLTSGLELQVPLFCTIGDKIEVDTRTHEYRGRA